MALKFAGALGCEVTALSSSASKKNEAIKNGAHKFIAHADEAEMTASAASLDFLLVTLATQETVDFSKFFSLLRPRGTMCFVGMCPPITADVFNMGFVMHNITTSNTGGRKEMLEMLEFCARHKIGASIVKRPMKEINEAISELHTKNVPYRFVMTNEDILDAV
uniref:Alcohol dehydrogenase-like C-terminal domain-containing protein n=1 Tax=Haptolina brevifila TaxID=156173 RepID=A0A6U7HBT6_9EUKA|mmetsp:Transcript_53178/g.105746  ORF Transcript_53178/g.105746 Transcript_53178/m.105746 type:complete len:164 (+) Transcript_53178:290-781(+)